MWQTNVARELGFSPSFTGYGQAEDLEFSLRAGQRGKLVLSTRARLLHLQEPSGRHDAFQEGYMGLYNRFVIHRMYWRGRARWAILHFTYSWTLDTLMLCRGFLSPRQFRGTCLRLLGRAAAARDIFRKATGRSASTPF
jgi:GT2 family glycosyltransferase